MDRQRRKIIMASLALMATGCAGRLLPAAQGGNPLNLILGGGRYKTGEGDAVKYVLSILDLESGAHELTEMGFLPHGIHRNPVDMNRLAIFEKRGPGACEYDLKKREIVRAIPVVGHRSFYGHGAYSADGRILYSTETSLDTLDGVIGMRDSRDLRYLGEFPSYGKEPHECKLIAGGKVLAVTNGGGPLQGDAPSVAYIDVTTRKLIEKITLASPNINAGHLAVSHDGTLVVVSAPRSGMDKNSLGGISIHAPGKATVLLSDPQAVTAKMFGESLSVVIHEQRGILAVTDPGGNMVTFWSLKDDVLLMMLELPYPRGIELTVDGKYFIVSYGEKASVGLVSAETLALNTESVLDQTFITGSHIYNWSRPMSELFAPGPVV